MTRIADSADGDGRPDPGMAGTAEEFVASLRRLKDWAGVGFRRLEKRAAAAGESLPRSTLTAALSRATLPREDLVAALVRACGCGADEVRRWVAARRRIAATAPSPPPPPAGSGGGSGNGGDGAEAGPVREPVRCTLPADQAVFVGRDKERDQILTAASGTGPAGGVIAIHAIAGMPGIGKTTLAVHAAHRLAGRFPDRQLFIDLHGHTSGREPLPPADALAELLAADGLDPRFLPVTVDSRAGLWRDRLAGRRLLLVLDNAASTEQVLPLLPGSPDSLVLVTSRRHLGDLPAAVPMPLDVLPADDAVRLFVRLAPRAAGDQDAVVRLVRACGYLPLAISIAASVYMRHRSWAIGDLVADIHRSAGGMLTLTAEDRTVAAVFDLSYRHLAPDRQRFFRLLGLHPGSDVDSYAAAALAGVPPDVAAGHLDALHGDHMLEEPAYRRYRMHDLIRAYSRTLTDSVDPAGSREQAVGRLLDYYTHTASRAERHLARHRRPATTTVTAPAAPPSLASWEEAVAWLRTERANLLAGISHAVSHGQLSRVVELTAGVAGLLRTDGPWADAVSLHETAVDAAHGTGDRRALANALSDLADVRRHAGDTTAAADLLDRADRLYRTLGDRGGEANTIGDLGVLRRLTGDYAAAADLIGEALHAHRELTDRRGETTAVHELGVVRWVTGDYPAAAELLSEALGMYRALGNRRGEANALNDLGVVWLLTGDYPAATYLLGQGRDLQQALGDRRGEATALQWLGLVRRLTGDYVAAADLLDRALGLHRALGNRHGEAIALNELGTVRRLTGDYPAAAELLGQALRLHGLLADRHSTAIASTRLAVVERLTGDHAGAAARLREALAVFRELGAPDDEAEALNHLGTVLRLTGRPEESRDLHRQALDVSRRIRHRLEEAHALEGIGRASLPLGEAEAGFAVSCFRQALDLYRQLGVPEAGEVTRVLATLDESRRKDLAS